MRALILSLAFFLGGWAHLRAGDDADAPALHWTRDYRIPIHTHSDGYDRLPFGQVRGAVEAALRTWGEAGITVSFARDPNGRDGDTPAMDGVSMVRFEHERLPREVDPRRVLAFTSHVGVLCTGGIAESDITFNAVTVDWSTGEGGRLADIETVMLHEAGHLLGLDHSENRNAVMFPSIVERSRRALHNDDRDGIRALYAGNLGRVCERDADCQRGEACIFGPQSDQSFEARCGPRLGGAGVGQRCNANRGFCESGCAGGVCLGDNICSGVCRDDRDCPGDLTCLAQDTGGGQLIKFCLNLRLCEDRIGECPNGQACVVTRHPEEARALRICVDAGESGLGQPCRSSDACAGGLCFGGLCTSLCDGAADCPAPFGCEQTQLGLGGGVTANIGLCQVEQQPCARQRDCAEGLACAYVEVNGEVGSLCVPGEGAEADSPCRDGSQCRSAVCLDGLCSDVCRNDGDCPRSMECQRIRFLGTSVNACVLIDTPEPEPDAAEPAPEPDAGEAPAPDGAPQPPADGGPPPPRADAARPNPEGGVVVVTPVSGGGGGGGSPSGCSSGPAPGVGGWWWCLVASSRRRRPGPSRAA